MPDLNVNITAHVDPQLRGTLQEARADLARLSNSSDQTAQRLAGMSVGAVVLDHMKESFDEAAKHSGSFAHDVAHHLAITGAAHVIYGERVHIATKAFSLLRFVAARALSGIAPAAAGAIGGLSLVLVSVKLVSGALSLLERASGAVTAGLGRFSFLEDLTGRLLSFTGSAEAARQKLGELNDTFRGTPVNVPDAVDAFRSARVADSGTGELSGSKGLTLMGDVAAASGNGIAEVTAATGALYSALRNGEPIEEAADELRKMGAISGDTRGMLDRLLHTGKSGPEVWGAFRAELEKSSGAMKSQEQTLTSLQKNLQDAKDRLYTSFAEGSVPFEKDKLTAKTIILQKLQPAAQEAGDVYGGAKNAISDLIKKLLELVGVKAVTDAALEDSSTVKTLTDGYILLRLAMATFGVVAIPALVGAAVAAGGLTLAATATAAAIAGIAAAVAAAGGGLFIYKLHMDKANEARLAFLKGSDDIIVGLHKERIAMTTLADKAVFLANAYERLKNAREALANAKTGKEKEDARARVAAIEAEIKLGTRVKDSSLKPTAAGDKTAADLATAKDKADDLARGEDAKHERATNAAEDARQKQMESRGKVADLEKRFAPDGAEGDPAIDAEIAKAQEIIKASRRKVTDATKLQERAGALGHDYNFKANMEAEKNLQSGQQKRVNDLEVQKAGRQQRLNVARDELAARDVVVQNAENDQTETGRAKDTRDREQRIGTAEADAEAKLAALQSEGIQRAREEYDIRRQLLEIKIREATVEGDAVKLAKLTADYSKGQQEQFQKEADAARALAKDVRAFDEAKAERRDAADTRQLDRDAKAGTITDQQHREGAAAILERKKGRSIANAVQKDKEAEEARRGGDEDGAVRLATEAEDSRAQADALGAQQEDLLHPEQQRERAVADSMRRVGGGGNAFFGPPPGADLGGAGKDPKETKLDRQIKLLEKIEERLRDGNEKRGGSTFQ